MHTASIRMQFVSVTVNAHNERIATLISPFTVQWTDAPEELNQGLAAGTQLCVYSFYRPKPVPIIQLIFFTAQRNDLTSGRFMHPGSVIGQKTSPGRGDAVMTSDNGQPVNSRQWTPDATDITSSHKDGGVCINPLTPTVAIW